MTALEAETGRHPLLRSKVSIPSSRSDLIERPRLLDALDGVLGHQLALVSAPAGFGKSTLLAAWAQSTNHPTAWLSLDSDENHPSRFWRNLVVAISASDRAFEESLALLLSDSQAPTAGTLAGALASTFDAIEGNLLLLLDDYHLIEQQEIHEGLMLLMSSIPERLHVVIAGRADPPMPLARLRARGRLVELRAADLRFEIDEAKAFVRQGFGLELPSATVEALVAKTEGWAAGLQLAALTLRGRADPIEAVESMSGGNRYVDDFLTDEVLSGLPERVRAFLLETSVLTSLTAPLCDAVTGRTDARSMLEYLEQHNLFLVPLDDEREWWRYHHLFADLLRVRLSELDATQVRQLHRNAAIWCESKGHSGEVIRHFLAAGDPESAAKVIEQSADELLLRSEGVTLQRWLSSLPPEVLGGRPRLLLARARFLIYGGRLDEMEAALTAAERTVHASNGEPFQPTLGTGASPLANIPAVILLLRAFATNLRGVPERATTYANEALTQCGEGEWALRGIAGLNLAAASWLQGRLPDADRALKANLAHWEANYAYDRFAFSCHYLGRLRCAAGDLDGATDAYRRAIDIASEAGGMQAPLLGIAYVGLAQVAYQRNEIDDALNLLSEGLPLCKQSVYIQPQADGNAMLACIRQLRGDTEGAIESGREARRLSDPAVVEVLNSAAVFTARLMLSRGDVSAAERWVQERGLRAGDVPSYPREPGYLVLVRVLIAQERLVEALDLLERLRRAAFEQRRAGSQMEIELLRACVLVKQRSQKDALEALEDALAYGEPQGHVRLFADEGAAVVELLQKLSTRYPAKGVSGARSTYINRILAAMPESEHTHLPQRVASSALTDRELEVLQLLAAGKRNREVAEELVVTLDTVKKHTTHIFEKVAVENRTSAVARGRELGLIS